MPSSGKVWHCAAQTGRGAERREKNSSAGERRRGEGEDLVNSASLVLEEEDPAVLAVLTGKSLVCVLDWPFIALIAEIFTNQQWV